MNSYSIAITHSTTVFIINILQLLSAEHMQSLFQLQTQKSILYYLHGYLMKQLTSNYTLQGRMIPLTARIESSDISDPHSCIYKIFPEYIQNVRTSTNLCVVKKSLEKFLKTFFHSSGNPVTD